MKYPKRDQGRGRGYTSPYSPDFRLVETFFFL